MTDFSTNQNDIFERTSLILGNEKLNLLKEKKVAVFGIGGVGSFAAESIVRAGIGHIVLVDDDAVSFSNINRQLIALHSTVGRKKTEVMKERLLDINPDEKIELYDVYFDKNTVSSFDFASYDYIVDCIDSVTSKILLIEKANEFNVPIISSMGTGNKIDPTKFEITDIYKTSVCPLARVMRHELKKRHIPSLEVIYSREVPIKPTRTVLDGKRVVPGSISFVPPVAGMIAASVVIRRLTELL